MLGVGAGELHSRVEIEAEGEVQGSLLRLANTLRRGGVQAGLLLASKEVSGFSVIDNPDTASLAQFRQELSALRERLENALITGDTTPSPAIDNARRNLADAANGLPKPNAQNVPGPTLRHLAEAADHMIHAAETSQARMDLTLTTARLTVATVALWTVAERLLAMVEA